MSYRRRVDGNHAEIRGALRKRKAELGILAVIDTHALADGFPDLVLVLQSGRVLLVELKTDPKPTDMVDEVKFIISLVSPAYRIALDEASVVAAIEELREA